MVSLPCSLDLSEDQFGERIAGPGRRVIFIGTYVKSGHQRPVSFFQGLTHLPPRGGLSFFFLLQTGQDAGWIERHTSVNARVVWRPSRDTCVTEPGPWVEDSLRWISDRVWSPIRSFGGFGSPVVIWLCFWLALVG